MGVFLALAAVRLTACCTNRRVYGVHVVRRKVSGRDFVLLHRVHQASHYNNITCTRLFHYLTRGNATRSPVCVCVCVCLCVTKPFLPCVVFFFFFLQEKKRQDGAPGGLHRGAL